LLIFSRERLEVTSKTGVEQSLPGLPVPPLFDLGSEFHKFLLTKCTLSLLGVITITFWWSNLLYSDQC